jgi:hypothetical protein
MKAFLKKKLEKDVQLIEASKKVDELEARVKQSARELIRVVDDPWCREILKSIHE